MIGMVIPLMLFVAAGQALPSANEVMARARKTYAGLRVYDDDVRVYDLERKPPKLIAEAKMHYRAPKQFRYVYKWLREGATTTITENAQGKIRSGTVVWRRPLRWPLTSKGLTEDAAQKATYEPIYLLRYDPETFEDATVTKETVGGKACYCINDRFKYWWWFDVKTMLLVQARYEYTKHMFFVTERYEFHPKVTKR